MTNAEKLEFRPYSLYVSREILQEKLEEGYEEVAFSYEGRWPRDRTDRITRMCVFFSPDGKIETYEHHEIADITVIRAIKPYQVTLRDNRHLGGRLEGCCIGVGKRRKITDVLQDAFGWEFR